tara:strand:+ start:1087 stop:1704 length:618 start_codon:yes stop_codon:yes gene_type:complete
MTIDKYMARFHRKFPGENPKNHVDWFRNNSRKVIVEPSSLLKHDRDNLVNNWNQLGIGKVYLGTYYAKWHKELPYWDTHPVFIPIGPKLNKDGTIKRGSILAMNLHYLPPVLRAKLLSELFETENNAQYNDTKKMQINYGILVGASKFSYFRPCVKEYLSTQWRSRFLRVPYNQWAAVSMMPLERFNKATRQQVWNDSRKIIKGR